LNDTVDQNTAAEPATAAAAEAPAEPETTARATQPVPAPQTSSKARGEGWLSKGVRNGLLAAVIVVVAGAFFTIGWFTSTRGDQMRPGMMIGIQQQGSDRWQGQPGPRWGMDAPEQGQQGGQVVPPGEDVPDVTSVQRAYLGVGLRTVTPELQKQHGLSRSDGALVATLDRGGPAFQAGIRRGDIITSIDGTPVAEREEVVSLVGQMSAGQSVSVGIDRNGQSLTFQVTLGERPASAF
jgi:membrane-associated protease RseP (regulator of RpoE activity)